MRDIVDLIRADHERIRDLFARLGTTEAREPESLARIWAKVSALLEAHIDAAEETGYPPALPGTPDMPRRRARMMAGHGDIRESLAGARLHPVATRNWWLAVNAARVAAMRHIDEGEATVLVHFRDALPRQAREALADQWLAFVRARALDVTESQTGDV